MSDTQLRTRAGRECVCPASIRLARSVSVSSTYIIAENTRICDNISKLYRNICWVIRCIGHRQRYACGDCKKQSDRTEI